MVTIAGASVITTRMTAAVEHAGADIDLIDTFGIGARESAPDAEAAYTTFDGEPLGLSIYQPSGASTQNRAPVLVFVHGGGWVAGDRAAHSADLRWFAEQGWLTISVDYTLSTAERHLWDVTQSQIGCALAWVAANAQRYGGDPRRLSLSGDSAGGNLAINTAYLAAAGRLPSSCGGRVPAVGAVSALYPVVDPAGFYNNDDPAFGGTARDMAGAYTGGSPQQFPQRYAAISSATYISAAAPPTLIIARRGRSSGADGGHVPLRRTGAGSGRRRRARVGALRRPRLRRPGRQHRPAGLPPVDGTLAPHPRSGDHGVMADAELDELFAAKPEDFTALRTKLAAAAKRRGDADAAKRIAAARKPTTAAWVVNRLAVGDKSVKERVDDLRERLRAAHAEMDGERIRGLSTEQRRLVDELAKAGFSEASLADPPAALRDDVIGTLQAAVADPDVAARLGRLAKAERWSGFGDFGDTAMVFTATRREKPAPKPSKPEPAKPVKEQPRDDKRVKARADLAAAERAKAEADDALSELQSDLATARLRQQDASRRLAEAERGLTAAEDAYDAAKQASRDAANLVKDAKAKLRAIAK